MKKEYLPLPGVLVSLALFALAGTRYPGGYAWSHYSVSALCAADRPAETAQILEELNQSHSAFAAAAASVPEDKFEEGRAAYRIIHLTGIHHYGDHTGAIREWRKSMGI